MQSHAPALGYRFSVVAFNCSPLYFFIIFFLLIILRARDRSPYWYDTRARSYRKRTWGEAVEDAAGRTRVPDRIGANTVLIAVRVGIRAGIDIGFGKEGNVRVGVGFSIRGGIGVELRIGIGIGVEIGSGIEIGI